MASKRHFIISGRHKRLQRLWQFFFTGWGLVMLCALVAGAILNQNMLWTPIRSINMDDIMQNQFKMENLSFAGVDKNGHPFMLKSRVARQEYESPDKIFMDDVTARTVRVADGQTITDDIRADTGIFNRAERTATLSGDVRVYSDNGDRLRTNTLVIRL
jgi:hypothetical protein